jgi:ATP-dependent DNA helicase RecQ
VAKLQKKSFDNRTEIKGILSRYWGYENFRPLQEEIILSVLEGKDTLALMPTGGGKSVTFQVPALFSEGICLVVTPLIALMKDQVDRLKERGIKAAAIHSGLTRREISIALDNCVFGDYKFLYVPRPGEGYEGEPAGGR